MLEPIRRIIANQRNILASTSPRRQELLRSIQFKFDIIKPNFEENLDKASFSHPCEYVKENAKQKAMSVWRQLNNGSTQSQCDLIIGCDTVVTLDGTIYEKPTDTEDAIRMLRIFSGKTHTVFTGVALITNCNSKNSSSSSTTGCGSSCSSTPEPGLDDYLVTTFHEATDVTFTELSESIIQAYVNTGEPLDKAGGYGIQGIGATLIESVRGDYFNVVGLPLHRLSKELYYMYVE
ncbi:hypothetical protein RDWZM_009238 [Blomia tropicalis]|uniref:N-acetylserotonin O-methyltransferase-like protein n=1 Tax=Blomia tropicalis TaxID=40697 RepID=A0A9Q0RM50_BLOTA|nr:hypothetical protein BLOT_005234 [Blomia tropicalis]KAJ6218081.1 hypothetical protein RDWZM_009238 [Blomia tropicalis]